MKSEKFLGKIFKIIENFREIFAIWNIFLTCLISVNPIEICPNELFYISILSLRTLINLKLLTNLSNIRSLFEIYSNSYFRAWLLVVKDSKKIQGNKNLFFQMRFTFLWVLQLHRVVSSKWKRPFSRLLNTLKPFTRIAGTAFCLRQKQRPLKSWIKWISIKILDCNDCTDGPRDSVGEIPQNWPKSVAKVLRAISICMALFFLSERPYYLSNLCTTTTFGTQKLWSLLTGFHYS